VSDMVWLHSAAHKFKVGPLWSWYNGSWIYNYVHILLLKLWIRNLFLARCTGCNIIWWSLSVTWDRSVVFSGFLHQWNWGVLINIITYYYTSLIHVCIAKYVFPIGSFGPADLWWFFLSNDEYDLAILMLSKKKMIGFITWISKSMIWHVMFRSW
jgi:hypothetical protein